QNLRQTFCAVVIVVLVGCATAPHASQPGKPTPGKPISVKPVAAENDLPLQLIDGQFKLQTGNIAAGAAAYIRAAQLSKDPSLAEQATQLALVAKDWDTAELGIARWQELSPGATGIDQSRGWVALGRGDDETALAEFTTLIGKPGGKGWQMVGQALLPAPDKKKAAALLSNLATAERLGNDELTWVGISQLAFKLGDKRHSQDLSDQAVIRFHGVESTAWNAQLALDRGDKLMARDIYRQGLEQQPASARLRVGYAALQADLGDEEGAATTLAAGKQDDLTYAARMAYAVRGDDKPALTEIYREVLADPAPHAPARLYLLGQLAELNEDYAKAIGWYREVPLDNERWFDAQTRISVALDESGSADEAVEVTRRLQVEAGLDNEAVGKSFLLEADLHKRHGNPAKARAVYDRALSFLPDDVRLLYSRALLAAASGDIKVAETDLRAVIEQEPENSAALNALGYTLADQTSRLDEAVILIERAHQLSPDEPSIIDSLGWVQFKLGRYAEAVATLKQAYDKFPDPEVSSHYAEALWFSGNRELARKVLANARKNAPDNAQLRDTEKRLKP
ncbi:MAG: tetratricopeptide repeat protein, partial [Dokdonella sp.]